MQSSASTLALSLTILCLSCIQTPKYTSSFLHLCHDITPFLLLPSLQSYPHSTSQAKGHDSDVLLKPVNFYRDPFFLVCINLYN